MRSASKHPADFQPAYMRRPEAARYLGVSTRTITEWQRRRIIPHVRMGRKCVLFPVIGLDAAMGKFTVHAIGSL